MKNSILWTKIQNFKLDNPSAQFTFSQRLARDNNWSSDVTQKTIQEYKKFIYLCCVSEQSITPSDAVDQVWHLHLTYTKSYWVDFCKHTLEKEIHHNPTKGGTSEKEKYNNCYDHTFMMYTQEFGENPPQDIWLDSTTRFTQINYKRINVDNYWMIKKPTTLRNSSLVMAALIALIASLFIQAQGSFIIIFIFIAILIIISIFNKGKGNGNGCSYDDDYSDWGDSDSGCSGCSGCGD